MQNLIDQLLGFEKGSTMHDDAPDALQSAIMELNGLASVLDLKTRSRKDYIGNKKNRM